MLIVYTVYPFTPGRAGKGLLRKMDRYVKSRWCDTAQECLAEEWLKKRGFSVLIGEPDTLMWPLPTATVGALETWPSQNGDPIYTHTYIHTYVYPPLLIILLCYTLQR